jgi:hypothetical protein
MKVLCIHGIGHQEAQKDNWQPAWTQAVNDTLNRLNPAIGPHQIDFLDYDDLFEAPLARLGYADFVGALGRLVWGRLTRPRGLFDFSDQTRWYPGMVVVWVNQPQLRGQLRDRLADKVSQFEPDLILAHSLGSLVAYDTFAQDPTKVQDRTLLTFGSQIGNPYVVGSVFAGRIGPLPGAKHWYPDANQRLEGCVNDVFLAFYSQLPYEAYFMMMLDCCYSGGLTRGSRRPRGLEPPDDIRHRMLRWDKDKQMWVDRPLTPLNPTIARQRDGKDFLGENKATVRLGRGIALRPMPNDEYDRTRRRLHHKGPFMPIVYEACGENELSYEYQHGAIGHGAFTYALAAALRRSREPLTFTALLKETAKELKDLGYDQTPKIAGPKEVMRAHVPWSGSAPRPPTSDR